jgi:hypothetical protein
MQLRKATTKGTRTMAPTIKMQAHYYIRKETYSRIVKYSRMMRTNQSTLLDLLFEDEQTVIDAVKRHMENMGANLGKPALKSK